MTVTYLHVYTGVMSMAIDATEKMFTVSDLSERFGVSPQRVHALIKTYKVMVHKIADGKLFLIPESEIKKIPKSRPNGVRRNPEKKQR